MPGNTFDVIVVGAGHAGCEAAAAAARASAAAAAAAARGESLLRLFLRFGLR